MNIWHYTSILQVLSWNVGCLWLQLLLSQIEISESSARATLRINEMHPRGPMNLGIKNARRRKYWKIKNKPSPRMDANDLLLRYKWSAATVSSTAWFTAWCRNLMKYVEIILQINIFKYLGKIYFKRQLLKEWLVGFLACLALWNSPVCLCAHTSLVLSIRSCQH